MHFSYHSVGKLINFKDKKLPKIFSHYSKQIIFMIYILFDDHIFNKNYETCLISIISSNRFIENSGKVTKFIKLLIIVITS